MLDRTKSDGLRDWPTVEVGGLRVSASTLRDAARDTTFSR